MKVKRSARDDGRIELNVTAPPEKVNEAIAFLEFRLALENRINPSKEADLTKAVKEKVGEAYYNSFIEFQVPHFLAPFAVEKEGLDIIMAPEVVSGAAAAAAAGSAGKETPNADKAKAKTARIAKPAPGKAFEFTVLVTPKPAYELDDYSPVSIKLPRVQVSDAEIDQQLLKIADTYATYEKDQDRPVQAGDHILFSIEAKNASGEVIKGFTADRRLYSLGENFMPEEFDQAILGMDIGESRTFDVTGPNLSRTSLDDAETETLTFSVTLLEIQKRVIPAITDAWVEKNIPGKKTVPELREAIREQGLKEREKQAEGMKAYLAASELAQRFKAKIPDEFYEFTRDELMQNLMQNLRRQNKTLEEFVEAEGGQQQFSMQLMMQTRAVLTQTFSLDALARHLGLTVEPADIEATYAVMAPGHEKEARTEFEKTGRVYLIREAALRNKANRWLVETANIEYYE
ncbi:MAG: hypothetical protein LBO07_07175 [Coriobacteriales bacterium]|jgi:trigger factor|nr:hypothetical protein [Coriobacteriales bacterium]